MGNIILVQSSYRLQPKSYFLIITFLLVLHSDQNPQFYLMHFIFGKQKLRLRCDCEEIAGLFAWAADVVGGSHNNEEDDNNTNSITLIFTPQQQSYLIDLDRNTTSLTRTIQDLWLRLPPSDISQHLPHIHAYSLASNNALILQLNAHSATKEKA